MWPRWHTLMFQGYGYPVLSFNGPLPYVVAVLLSYVTPSLEMAYKGMLLMACLGYSAGMYLWTRDIIGPWGALIAAAAYTFAPFRYRELYFLGGYCQFLAWSLYPWVLFFFRRLAERRSRGIFLGAVASLAGLALSHNISVMLFAPFFGVYLLGLMVGYWQRRPWGWLIGAIACALTIAAMLLLPAFGEMSLTYADASTHGYWDISNHMLRLADFFAPSVPLDDRAALSPLPFNFGRWSLILAALGGLTLVLARQSVARRLHIALGLFMMVGAGFMMLPASLPVWRGVPFFNFSEYAFRIFGCASLGSALLAGAAAAWVARWPRVRLVGVAAAVIGLIMAVAVYQTPRPFVPITPTPAHFLSYEITYRALGTTGGAEFLSRAVTVKPTKPAVAADLSRTALIDAPAGVSAQVVSEDAGSLRFVITAAAPSTVTLAHFYFPGWRAWLDNAPIALRSTEKTGLIQLDVPAGQHDLLLKYGDTPIRVAAGWISLVGLLAAAVFAWKMRPPRALPAVTERGHWQEAAVLTTLLAALALLMAFWIGPHTSWFRLTSPPGQALPARNQAHLPVSEKAAIIGYDIDQATVRQGDELHVRLYWQTSGPLDDDYASFVKLSAGSQAQVFAQSDHVHPGELPTTTWTDEQYVVDDHFVRIPADAPAVAMKITAGLYRGSDLALLGSVYLPVTEHVLARHAPSATSMSRTSASLIGDGIELLGHRTEAEQGVIRLTLFWQAHKAPTADYHVFVHALAPDGRIVAQADGPPVDGLYLTSDWLPGQLILDTHEIRLPAGVNPASVQIGLYDLSTLLRLPARQPDGAAWPDDAVVIQVGS
ncbi:MAG: hypothetical protein CVU38_13025 [Chloroflexi bacterium HGW-Chloroflexi-1]|nr:MAG: hypothetical protein CVU38_13025 [Chloroflexi bacterium HGW-Chloroflexi-1]